MAAVTSVSEAWRFPRVSEADVMLARFMRLDHQKWLPRDPG